MIRIFRQSGNRSRNIYRNEKQGNEMSTRYAAIWFRHLTTDWLTLRRPLLKNRPFVFASPANGRMVITAASPAAESQGVTVGMVVADAKVFIPGLEVIDDNPGLAGKLLKALGL